MSIIIEDSITLIPQDGESDDPVLLEVKLKSSPAKENMNSNTVPNYTMADDQRFASKYSALFCLLCNIKENFLNKKELLNIFVESNCAKYSKMNLSKILSEALNVELHQDMIHSEWICNDCHLLINHWDHLQLQLRSLQKVLINNYTKTYKERKETNHKNEKPLAPEESETCNNDSSQEKSKFECQDIALDDSEYIPYIAIKTRQKKKRGKERGKTNNLLKSRQLQIKNKSQQFEKSYWDKDFIQNVLSNYESVRSYTKTSEEKDEAANEGPKLTMMNQETTTKNLICNESQQFCDSCNYKTFSSSEMTHHHRSHFCDICGLFLTNPNQIRIHLVKVHNYSDQSLNATKKFSCNICHKRYSSMGSLHNHKKSIHCSSLYPCQVCGQVFRHPRLLSAHSIRHKNKTVKCSECNSMFFSVSECNKHINQVHRKVRSYECPQCGKFFCQRSVLTHHLSQHTNEGFVSNDVNTQQSDVFTTNKRNVFAKEIFSKGGLKDISLCLQKKLNMTEPNSYDIRASVVENQQTTLDSPSVSLEFEFPDKSSEIERISKDEIEINVDFETTNLPTTSATTDLSCLDLVINEPFYSISLVDSPPKLNDQDVEATSMEAILNLDPHSYAKENLKKLVRSSASDSQKFLENEKHFESLNALYLPHPSSSFVDYSIDIPDTLLNNCSISDETKDTSVL